MSDNPLHTSEMAEISKGENNNEASKAKTVPSMDAPEIQLQSSSSSRRKSLVTQDPLDVRLLEAGSESNISALTLPSEVGTRASWDHKWQFVVIMMGYSVGLGNVWRFPYLCQKNGGFAFLILYCIMLALVGIPIYYLELAFGQRMRKGAIGAWSLVHSKWKFGGLGIASAIGSIYLLIRLIIVIAWCISYLFESLQYPPYPWDSCPLDPITEGHNTTYKVNQECDLSSPTQYHWYRSTLNISGNFGEFGTGWNWNWCLVIAWLIVILACVITSISSSSKIASKIANWTTYLLVIFIFLVLIIFFFLAITRDGAFDGYSYMFRSDFNKLGDPQVWLEAMAQMFFSLDLAFGEIVAKASYTKTRSNYIRDTIVTVSIVDCATSVLASVAIFSCVGFKAHKDFKHCNFALENFFAEQLIPYKIHLDGSIANISQLPIPGKTYIANVLAIEKTMPDIIPVQLTCSLQKEMNTSASGIGLIFMAFTEVASQFTPIFAVLFFLMLVIMGVSSMVGGITGITTSLLDMNLFPGVRKEYIYVGLCTILLLLSHVLVFVPGNGSYIVGFLDMFINAFVILIIAFCECIIISYVYGTKRFADDIELMKGDRPSLYWQTCWKYISPVAILIVFIASLIDGLIKRLTYQIWFYGKDASGELRASSSYLPYPDWSLILAAFFIFIALLPILAVMSNLLKLKKETPTYFPVEELRREHNLKVHEPTDYERLILHYD